jgi:hypothetical protein
MRRIDTDDLKDVLRGTITGLDIEDVDGVPQLVLYLIPDGDDEEVSVVMNRQMIDDCTKRLGPNKTVQEFLASGGYLRFGGH